MNFPKYVFNHYLKIQIKNIFIFSGNILDFFCIRILFKGDSMDGTDYILYTLFL